MVLKWWPGCALALTVIWTKSAHVRALRLLSKLHKNGGFGGRFFCRLSVMFCRCYRNPFLLSGEECAISLPPRCRGYCVDVFWRFRVFSLVLKWWPILCSCSYRDLHKNAYVPAALLLSKVHKNGPFGGRVWC